MSIAASLSRFLLRPDIWRGDRLARGALPGVQSGFPMLDAELPDGGWPRGALSEVIVPREGVGELSLLLPALASISAAGGWIALIASPLPPYAPAWQQAGIDLRRLLVLRPDAKEAVFCTESVLASGAFAATISWLPQAQPRALRRLQLAVSHGSALAFVLRPPAAAMQASPASLRVGVEPAHSGALALRILKRRGMPLSRTLQLAVGRPLHERRLARLDVEPGVAAVAGSAVPAASAGSFSAA